MSVSTEGNVSNLINMSGSWPGGFNAVSSCRWEIRWLSYQVIMSEWVIAFVLSASACHEEIWTNHGYNLPLWPIKDNSRHPSGDTNGGNLNLLLVFRKSLSVISEKSSLHICVVCVSVFLISNSRTLFFCWNFEECESGNLIFKSNLINAYHGKKSLCILLRKH